MVVANPAPPPSAVRPEDIAVRMERMLNKVAEENQSPPGLLSRVRYLPDEPHEDGELVFEVSASGEEFGGPMAVKQVVSRDRLEKWGWTEGPFRTARSDVLRLMQRRLFAERDARDEEE